MGEASFDLLLVIRHQLFVNFSRGIFLDYLVHGVAVEKVSHISKFIQPAHEARGPEGPAR